MSFPQTPALTTDCVVLDERGRVLLVKRGSEPFKGKLALPGGFVKNGETVEDACRRGLKEEAGIAVNDLHLVGVYSEPSRGPRGSCVSVAFLAAVEGLLRRPAATLLPSNGCPT